MQHLGSRFSTSHVHPHAFGEAYSLLLFFIWFLPCETVFIAPHPPTTLAHLNCMATNCSSPPASSYGRSFPLYHAQATFHQALERASYIACCFLRSTAASYYCWSNPSAIESHRQRAPRFPHPCPFTPCYPLVVSFHSRTSCSALVDCISSRPATLTCSLLRDS